MTHGELRHAMTMLMRARRVAPAAWLDTAFEACAAQLRATCGSSDSHSFACGSSMRVHAPGLLRKMNEYRPTAYAPMDTERMTLRGDL